MKVESKFERELIERLDSMFPGCYITKLNANRTQGIPDRLILWKHHWAILEVKRSANEEFQPNQKWYVNFFDAMSFSAVIYPENMEEVLRALQQSFRSSR